MTPLARAYLWINVALVLAIFLLFAALDGKRSSRAARMASGASTHAGTPKIETVKVRVVTPEQRAARHPAFVEAGE